MYSPPPLSLSVVPIAKLVSIRLWEIVSVAAPCAASPPPRCARPLVSRTRRNVNRAPRSASTLPPTALRARVAIADA